MWLLFKNGYVFLVLVIVGNKIDLIEEEEVPELEAKAYAKVTSSPHKNHTFSY